MWNCQWGVRHGLKSTAVTIFWSSKYDLGIPAAAVISGKLQCIAEWCDRREIPCFQHIEAQTKWQSFRKRYFQMHFLKWKCLNFDQDFAEVCLKGSINNTPELVQILAPRPGDNPLSELMMVNSLTHICVAQPQRVKGTQIVHCTHGRLPFIGAMERDCESAQQRHTVLCHQLTGFYCHRAFHDFSLWWCYSAKASSNWYYVLWISLNSFSHWLLC